MPSPKIKDFDFKEPCWERQKPESAPAWEAFKLYRDIGDSRTCDKVAKQLGKSNTIIERWCTGYKWVERIRAWEHNLDVEGNAAAIEAVKEMRTRQISLASGFMAVAGEELKKLLALVKRKSHVMLNADQIVRMADFATRLERLNRGEPDSIQKQQHELTIEEKRESFRKFIGDPDVIKAVDKVLDSEIN